MPFTITYSDSFQGWPSFYTFYPDWMLGMNNYFYTWRGGNLYRHNDDSVTRNTFYLDWWIRLGNPGGAKKSSEITSVFNTSVLENALFKTIDIQGDYPWNVQLSTDIQSSGLIDFDWFEKKEGTYFAFIRNNSTGELSIRSTTGLGSTANMNPAPVGSPSLPPSSSVDLTYNFIVDSIISINDIIYYGSVPSILGTISNIVRGPSNTIITITTPATAPNPPSAQVYTLYTKNSVAESHGVLGHYCTFTMQTYSPGKIELFAVEADVMKSYP